MISSSPLALLAALCLAACTDSPSKRTQAQLDALKKKKATAANAEKDDALAPLPTDVARLEPPYDDTQAVVLTPDGPCPEGLWALFTGDVPGATTEEKRANAANRQSIAAALRARRFLVRLRGPALVTLNPWDAPRGRFTIDVVGAVDCTDPAGRITLAWTDARVVGPSAQPDQDESLNVWKAPPVTFELPHAAPGTAKTFFDQNRFGLSARVAFTLGQGEVDRKLKKVPAMTQQVGDEVVTVGGGTEDWGAGRLVRVTPLGVRVAAERERKQLFDQRPAP
jgi:hypothetical protein